MKKLLTACAACVLAGMVSAQVESVNVVGYAQKAVMANGWSLLGINWEAVGGGDVAFDALIGTNPDLVDGDVLQIYNPTGPAVSYTYYAPDWYDSELNVVHPLVPVGSGVWFFHDGPVMELTMAAQVKQEDVVSVLPANTWSQIAASTPIGFNPSDTGLVEWAGIEDGSVIQLYIDPNTSTSYTYYSPSWYDGDLNEITTPVLDIGEGAWFFNASATVDVTLTQHAP